MQIIDWPLLRSHFREVCVERALDQKQAAADMVAPASMVSRFLNGKTVSADNFMLVCWWMEVEANDYRLI